MLVGALVWLGWYSPWLTATSVQVEGVSDSAATEVREVAKVPIGTPIMRIDTDAVTTRLTEHRGYATVEVSRGLPHTIVISVTPRVPVLAVKSPDGRVELVDDQGFAFRTVASAPKGIPQVTAGSSEITGTGLRAAINALSSLDPQLRRSVSAVTVTAAEQLTFSLTLKDGKRTVVWGAGGGEDTKARLVTILAKEPGTVIDVSVPGSPVTR